MSPLPKSEKISVILGATAALAVLTAGFLAATQIAHPRFAGSDDPSVVFASAPISHSRSDPSFRGDELDATELASRALQPRVGGLRFANAEIIPALVERLEARPEDDLSTFLHALHLQGRDAKVLFPDGNRQRIVDIICDADVTRRCFGDARVLAETRYGLRFPDIFPWAVGTDQSNTQSHIGQGLAALATSGVPLSQTVRCAEGHVHSVEDILRDVIANFSLEGEVFWDAVALSIYLPPGKSWENKFGEVYSFDQLVYELIARDPRNSSCDGATCPWTHRNEQQRGCHRGSSDRDPRLRRVVSLL